MKEALKRMLFSKLVYFLPRYRSVNGNDIGICTLLCHRDVDMFVWNLTSFFYFSDICLPIYVIDDGSLTEDDISKLKRHFNVVIGYSNNFANRFRNKDTRKWLFKFFTDKKTHVLKRKYIAMIDCPFLKYIYIDADLLFFDKPNSVLEWIFQDSDRSLFTIHNKMPANCYGDSDEVLIRSFRQLIFDKFNIRHDVSFNSGLMCIANKTEIDLDRFEKIIEYFYKIDFIYHRLAEETALAGVIPKTSLAMESDKYVNVWIDKEYHKNVDQKKVVSVHYSSFVKDGIFQKDALKLGLRTLLFRRYN